MMTILGEADAGRKAGRFGLPIAKVWREQHDRKTAPHA